MHIKLRLNLRGKFIVLISSILIVIFGLVAYLVINNARHTLTTNQNNGSKAFTQLSVKPIGDTFVLYQLSGTYLIDQEMQQFVNLDGNVSNISVVDLNGINQFNLNGTPFNISANAANSFTAVVQSNQSGQIVQIIQPYIDSSGLHSYAVVYRFSLSALSKALRSEELTIFIFSLAGLILSALATYGFVNRLFIKPISDVTNSARIIAAGYYSQQIAPGGSDEIGSLAKSVNHMADSLKDDINKIQEVDKLKTEFITITSHNLRTPLATIEASVSALKDEPVNDTLRSVINGIEKSTKRLTTFADQILTIASIEGGSNIVLSERVSIADLLHPLVDEFQKASATKSINFTTNIGNGDVIIPSNIRQLQEAIRDILDNAVKFTPEKGTISLITKASTSAVTIKISDTGIGIQESEIPKLFTPFHRSTETLVYNYEGVGIGLYVVRLIIEQHRGKISVESELGRGTVFTIELPLAANTQQSNMAPPKIIS